MRLCCPCHFGLERTLRFEITKIGGTEIEVQNGRVLFNGDEITLARANISLSTAERVLIQLGTFPARTFEELFQGVKSLPLEKWIGKKDAFPVKGHALSSKLHSVPTIQSIVKKAAVERLGRAYHVTWLEETGAVHQIQFSIRNDNAVIYLDTTGIGLHKRGYRKQANIAPLKETLAAGIVDLARVKSDSVVCDPFCGSGTILIESVFKAFHIAPGLNRRFQAETWQQISPNAWKTARAEARDAVRRDATFLAYGSDIDDEVLEIARENCHRAGVDSRIQLERRDIKDFVPMKGAITICNPPYGERMLDIEAARALYRTMGKVFPANAEFPCYIITPDADFSTCFGKEPDKKRKLYNGMLQCNLMQYCRSDSPTHKN